MRRSTSARLGQVRDGSRRMRPPKFLPTARGGGGHARSRFGPARSVFDRAAAERAELTEGACGRVNADDHPPAGDDPPAPTASGIDRAICLSTAAAVLAVAGIAAYVSTGTPTRSSGPTARPGSPPGSLATIDGLIYASSMVVLYAARHRKLVPSLGRWLLALGIARPSRRTWHRAGPTVRSGRWSAGRRSVSWALRTPGLAHPRSGAADRGPSAEYSSDNAAFRAAARPVLASAVDGERPAGSERGPPGPAWRSAGQAAGHSPILRVPKTSSVLVMATLIIETRLPMQSRASAPRRR